MESLVGQVTDVTGNGPYEAKLNRKAIKFDKVPEQPAWRPASIQEHHFQRRWWVTHVDYPKQVFIVGSDPREVRQLNLDEPVALIQKDDFKF